MNMMDGIVKYNGRSALAKDITKGREYKHHLTLRLVDGHWELVVRLRARGRVRERRVYGVRGGFHYAVLGWLA